MIFLKVYSLIFMIFETICSIYSMGKEEDILGMIFSVILLLPVVCYLILS